MDESVGGDDLVIVILETAIEVGEASAGFVYDEQAGGDVVGSRAGLPVAFEASAGDVAAVHGGGAEIAEGEDVGFDGGDGGEVVFFGAVADAADAGGQDAFLQAGVL